MQIGDARGELVEWVACEAAGPAPEQAVCWARWLSALPGAAAVLFYGSGLRDRTARDPDVVYDFYVLVHRYLDFAQDRILAVGGAILPPNVYYFEERFGGSWTRCKVAVMTISQFCTEATEQAFTPHIWARFCQPTRILFAESGGILRRLHEAMADCALSFHRRTLGLIDSCRIADLWSAGLRSTYADEIRSEADGRANVIYARDEVAFQKRTLLALRLLPKMGWIDRDGVVHSWLTPGQRRWRCLRLRLTRPFRKALIALRLIKAAFTFQNGLEYARWKVERHSGRRFEITDFEQRHPLWGGLILFCRAAQQGALR